MESTEKNPPREYSALEEDEKVRAILGAVPEPIPKQRVIELTGINYEGLEDEQKTKVDSVFTQEGIESMEKAGVTKYILGAEDREKLEKSVDMTTVYGTRADKMWEELGLKDNPE